MSLTESDLEAAIAEAGLLAPGSLVEACVRHHDEMVRWNRTHNLTRVEGAEAAGRHYVDCLAGLRALEDAGLGQPSAAVDLGSGAGFPGLIGALLWPQTSWSLVDSSAKRCSFLRHTAGLLGLTVKVRHMRAENLAERWPLVVSRATFSSGHLQRAFDRADRGGAVALWVGEGAQVEGAKVVTAGSTRVAVWCFT